jgi:hypothetical protein
MAKWLITWINGGKYNSKEIIPSSYVNEAMTVQMATGGGVPGAENPDVHFSGYGLGWGMASYRGHYRVEHGGGIDGFITTTGFFPSDSIGIFVSSNQGGVSSSIRNFIADRMLKLPYRNWNKYLLDADKKAKDAAKAVVKNDSLGRKFNTKPSHELADYTGTFSNKGYGSIEITLKDGNLFSKFNSIDIKFEHFHYDQFKAYPQDPTFDESDAFRVSFHTDDKGNISKLSTPFEAGVKDIEFEKETKKMDLSKADLEKYTGEYDMMGATVKVYINDKNTLMVLVPQQPDYELVPVKKDEFDLKILKGFSVKFDLDEKGESTAINFIQPNGTFKAPKKK